MSAAPGRDDGIKPEQEQESHISPSGSPHPGASISKPNRPSTPVAAVPALTQDKTPVTRPTTSNLLSWFRHPLATFTASLKRRRRCASSGENDDANAGRKKKVDIVGDDYTEEMANEAKALQEKKAPGSSSSNHGPAGGAADDHEPLAEPTPKAIGAITAAHVVASFKDDDAYVKKEEMAIGKQEKVKAKEQQGTPRIVVEKEWLRLGQPIDITMGNNHKVIITSPRKQPEYAPITIKAGAAHPATAIEDAAAENAEAATHGAEDTAVSAMRKIMNN